MPSAVVPLIGDLDVGRVVQHAADDVGDVFGQRRREQQVLTLLGQVREDPADARPEAHVEHAVGLVEHEDLDLREVDVLALVQVDEAARGRDQDLDAALEPLDLRLVLHAADDDAGALTGVLADDRSDLLDLLRELAGGRDHERERRARRRGRCAA